MQPYGNNPNRLDMKKAFTLIELLVVIAVLAIAASILIALFGHHAKPKSNTPAPVLENPTTVTNFAGQPQDQSVAPPGFQILHDDAMRWFIIDAGEFGISTNRPPLEHANTDTKQDVINWCWYTYNERLRLKYANIPIGKLSP